MIAFQLVIGTFGANSFPIYFHVHNWGYMGWSLFTTLVSTYHKLAHSWAVSLLVLEWGMPPCIFSMHVSVCACMHASYLVRTGRACVYECPRLANSGTILIYEGAGGTFARGDSEDANFLAATPPATPRIVLGTQQGACTYIYTVFVHVYMPSFSMSTLTHIHAQTLNKLVVVCFMLDTVPGLTGPWWCVRLQALACVYVLLSCGCTNVCVCTNV